MCFRPIRSLPYHSHVIRLKGLFPRFSSITYLAPYSDWLIKFFFWSCSERLRDYFRRTNENGDLRKITGGLNLVKVGCPALRYQLNVVKGR